MVNAVHQLFFFGFFLNNKEGDGRVRNFICSVNLYYLVCCLVRSCVDDAKTKFLIFYELSTLNKIVLALVK